MKSSYVVLTLAVILYCELNAVNAVVTNKPSLLQRRGATKLAPIIEQPKNPLLETGDLREITENGVHVEAMYRAYKMKTLQGHNTDVKPQTAENMPNICKAEQQLNDVCAKYRFKRSNGKELPDKSRDVKTINTCSKQKIGLPALQYYVEKNPGMLRKSGLPKFEFEEWLISCEKSTKLGQTDHVQTSKYYISIAEKGVFAFNPTSKSSSYRPITYTLNPDHLPDKPISAKLQPEEDDKGTTKSRRPNSSPNNRPQKKHLVA